MPSQSISLYPENLSSLCLWRIEDMTEYLGNFWNLVKAYEKIITM